jgi:hypothetical protein
MFSLTMSVNLSTYRFAVQLFQGGDGLTGQDYDEKMESKLL